MPILSILGGDFENTSDKYPIFQIITNDNIAEIMGKDYLNVLEKFGIPLNRIFKILVMIQASENLPEENLGIFSVSYDEGNWSLKEIP